MEPKPSTSFPLASPTLESSPRCTIRLTLRRDGSPQNSAVFSVALSELIAYAEQPGRTRLNLTGNRVVEVTETTAQIDLLVRSAASRGNLTRQSA
jgi:hypothetical protein